MQTKRSMRVFAPCILTSLLLLQSGLLSGAEWSTAATACAVDEGSAGKFASTEAFLNFAANQTGEIVVRCNVTNPLDSGQAVGWNRLQVTYLDPGNNFVNTADNQIQVSLRSVDFGTGLSQTIATFNSDMHSASFSAQVRSQAFNHTFSFLAYAYYIEIKIKRLIAIWSPGVYRVGLWKA